MSSQLLAISIGPVADFIQATRRTRDLQFASWLVAEMVRGSARAIVAVDPHAEIVVPASFGVDEPVTDQVLALLSGDLPPADVAVAARNGAMDVWYRCARGVLGRYKDLLGINEMLWSSQLDFDLMEFFAAWTPLGANNDYSKRRQRVELLLRAREMLVDFPQNRGLVSGLPKSSLDGRRESVLVPIDNRLARENATMRTIRHRRMEPRFRLRPGEQLDLPGLVKRLSDGPPEQRFASVTRIGIDPWIRGAANRADRRRALDRVSKLLTSGEQRIASSTANPAYSEFPFDGQVLLRPRVRAMERELTAEGDEHGADLCRKILEVLPVKDQPYPYLAALACDGDGMTQFVQEMDSTQHKAFSESLSGFAKEVQQIVPAHGGLVVYAGGDDVLAFLPLDLMLGCIRRIREAFRERVPEGTMSFGIAIVHVLTPMAGDMVRWAGEAEAHAKQPLEEDVDEQVLAEMGRTAQHAAKSGSAAKGNALAIHVHKRAGAPTQVRLPWPTDSNEPDPVLRMQGWCAALNNDSLPSGLPFDLQRLASDFMDESRHTLDWVNGNLVRAEAHRVLSRKQVDDVPNSGNPITAELARLNGARDLLRLSRELVVARAIVPAMRDAEASS